MNRKLNYALHIAAWVIIFFTPLMYAGHTDFFDMQRYIFFSVAPLTLVVVFYVNYLALVPHYYFDNRRKLFFLTNAVFILFLSICLHYWMHYCHTRFEPIKVNDGELMKPDIRPYVFMLRDMFNMMMSCVVATAIRLSEKLRQTEDARKEIEKAKTEAELKHLKSQINPHFLLNTLNNIYALTAIDASRAQNAIDELSKILRYVLYENDRDFVHLTDEINFLKNYVNLMRIRVSSNVEVKVNIDIPQDTHACIAPMIIISLVENAFKHGISASDPSYIYIEIKADNDMIKCHILNSNNPKPKSDHSGHGIGLKQVAKRLELAYKDSYKWEKWANEKEYNSKIVIYDTKLCYY
ncbi:MAG: sensor histidine kinase [Prevotella sp.]